MSWKEKTNNYLEEQKRTEEAKRKAELERSLQQEAVLKKEIAEYQKEALPLIEALNKTSVKQWLEEIKVEEGQWQNAKICLFPENKEFPYESLFSRKIHIPESVYVEIKLENISYETGWGWKGSMDNNEREEYDVEVKTSIGIRATFDSEQKIHFYSPYEGKYSEEFFSKEAYICSADDPECNQKIEKALVIELSRLRQKE